MALVCLTPDTDGGESHGVILPSYGIRRIQAAVTADPELSHVTVTMVDRRQPDLDNYMGEIEAVDPDIVGFSVYLWSLPAMVEVARRVKANRPDRIVVFGGPSARTAQFDLAPHRLAADYLDAVVPSEGELTFRTICALAKLDRASLATVPGLDLPNADGTWTSTGPRQENRNLDDIASPFQLGLMPHESIAYLETFRGCPFSCRFCEWGATEDASKVFSKDYLVRELGAFERNVSRAVYLLDAGLNLNVRAFRNLRDAAAETGFFKKASIWCEIYPSYLKDEHMEFLSEARMGWVGIGLQSLDPKVLRDLDRPFDQTRFETVLNGLARHVTAEIQIISGLPGDSPESFRETLAYARSLPASTRVYHCLILPDAFLTRSKPEWNMQFDPISMEMTSCLGWSREQVRDMRAELDHESRAAGGTAGNFWWSFPRRC